MSVDVLQGCAIRPPKGLRYWQRGGRGQYSGAKKLEAREMLENGGESPPSIAPEKLDDYHLRGEKPLIAPDILRRV